MGFFHNLLKSGGYFLIDSQVAITRSSQSSSRVIAFLFLCMCKYAPAQELFLSRKAGE